MWSYSVISHFKNEKYKNIIDIDDLQERKYFKKKVGQDSRGKSVYDELKGWLVNVGKEKVILPELLGNTDIRDMLPLKIATMEQFPYQNAIYMIPTNTGLKSFKIPAEKKLTFRELVDNYFNVEHTEPKQFLVYKLLIIGSFVGKYNWRVCTGAGFGKNGVIEVLSNLTRTAKVYCPKSDPKLMTMFDGQDLLVIDEWMDLDIAKKQTLEYVFRGASDGRTDLLNNALTSTTYKTKDNYDLSKLSIGFIYNELSYYMPPNISKDKRGEYFDNLYTLATKERFLPLYFSGRINLEQFDIENDREVYLRHKDDLRDWVMSLMYYKERFYEELKGKEDWIWNSQEILGGDKNNRMNHHLSNFRLILKAYAKDQEEYNELCDIVIERYFEYMSMLGIHITRTIPQYNIN